LLAAILEVQYRLHCRHTPGAYRMSLQVGRPATNSKTGASMEGLGGCASISASM